VASRAELFRVLDYLKKEHLRVSLVYSRWLTTIEKQIEGVENQILRDTTFPEDKDIPEVTDDEI
jgi:hypothetical protein